MLDRRVAFAFTVAAALGARASATTQEGTASLIGRLINRGTRDPIEGATVVLAGAGPAVSSDSSGGFRYRGLAPGDHRLEVRAIGYAKGVWLVSLAPGEQSREFELQGLNYELPEVVVEAHGVQAEFERRRAHGTGVFFTRAEIERRHAKSLGDLTRGVLGVQTICGRGSCTILMSRTGKGCRPEFYLDGFPGSFSLGPDFPMTGIYGVEVYRSASEAPAEFRKPELRCGVILMWSDMTR